MWPGKLRYHGDPLVAHLSFSCCMVAFSRTIGRPGEVDRILHVAIVLVVQQSYSTAMQLGPLV